MKRAIDAANILVEASACHRNLQRRELTHIIVTVGEAHMRHLFLTYVLIGLLLAGCAGGGEQRTGAKEAGRAAESPMPSATATAVATATSVSAATSPQPSDRRADVWRPYEFKKGEYYKFQFTFNKQSGYLTWKVKDVSPDGNTVTVEYGFTMGGTQFSGTVTGPKESVYAQTMMTPVGPIIAVTLYGPYVGLLAGHSLAVGTEWTVTTPEGSGSVKVEGKVTHAGVEFYRVVHRVNGKVALEACASPSLAFAGCVVGYEGGERKFEITLVEYEPGSP